MNKNKKRMGIYMLTGSVLVAVGAVLSVAVLKKRDSKNVHNKSILYG